MSMDSHDRAHDFDRANNNNNGSKLREVHRRRKVSSQSSYDEKHILERTVEDLKTSLLEEKNTSRRERLQHARAQRELARNKSEVPMRETFEMDLEKERMHRIETEMRLKDARKEHETTKSKLEVLQHQLRQMENMVRCGMQYKVKTDLMKQEKMDLVVQYENQIQKHNAQIGDLQHDNKLLMLEVKSMETTFAACPACSKTAKDMGPAELDRGRLLAERVRVLEEQNSELVVENEQQRLQYEHCLDEIANQVVQALMSQKSLREECVKLRTRVIDLEGQNRQLGMMFKQQFGNMMQGPNGLRTSRSSQTDRSSISSRISSPAFNGCSHRSSHSSSQRYKPSFSHGKTNQSAFSSSSAPLTIPIVTSSRIENQHQQLQQHPAADSSGSEMSLASLQSICSDYCDQGAFGVPGAQEICSPLPWLNESMSPPPPVSPAVVTSQHQQPPHFRVDLPSLLRSRKESKETSTADGSCQLHPRRPIERTKSPSLKPVLPSNGSSELFERQRKDTYKQPPTVAGSCDTGGCQSDEMHVITPSRPLKEAKIQQLKHKPPQHQPELQLSKPPLTDEAIASLPVALQRALYDTDSDVSRPVSRDVTQESMASLSALLERDAQINQNDTFELDEPLCPMASPESHSRDTLDTLDTVKSRDDAMRSRDTLESIGAVDDDVTRSAGSISGLRHTQLLHEDSMDRGRSDSYRKATNSLRRPTSLELAHRPSASCMSVNSTSTTNSSRTPTPVHRRNGPAAGRSSSDTNLTNIMVHKELTAKEKALLVKHVSKDKSKLLKLDKPSESAEESKKKSWKLRLSIKKNKTPKIKEPKQPEVSKKRFLGMRKPKKPNLTQKHSSEAESSPDSAMQRSSSSVFSSEPTSPGSFKQHPRDDGYSSTSAVTVMELAIKRDDANAKVTNDVIAESSNEAPAKLAVQRKHYVAAGRSSQRRRSASQPCILSHPSYLGIRRCRSAGDLSVPPELKQRPLLPRTRRARAEGASPRPRVGIKNKVGHADLKNDSTIVKSELASVTKRLQNPANDLEKQQPQYKNDISAYKQSNAKVSTASLSLPKSTGAANNEINYKRRQRTRSAAEGSESFAAVPKRPDVIGCDHSVLSSPPEVAHSSSPVIPNARYLSGLPVTDMMSPDDDDRWFVCPSLVEPSAVVQRRRRSPWQRPRASSPSQDQLVTSESTDTTPCDEAKVAATCEDSLTDLCKRNRVSTATDIDMLVPDIGTNFEASPQRSTSCFDDDQQNYLLHNMQVKNKGAKRAVVRNAHVPFRPYVDFRDFFIRYGESEQEAIETFAFLEEFPSSDENASQEKLPNRTVTSLLAEHRLSGCR